MPASSVLPLLQNLIAPAADKRAPEVVLAFVHSRLGSAEAAQQFGAYSSASSNLKALLESVPSSMVVPYVQAAEKDAPVSKVFASALPENSEAKVLTAALDKQHSCESLLQRLAAEPIYNNNVPDLVVVRSTDAALTDACVARATELVAERSKGRYLAALSAETAPTFMTFAAPVRPTKNFEAQAYPVPVNGVYRHTGVQMITSEILTAIILAWILVVTLIIGICLVSSIKTPVRFSSVKLTIGKEY